jgi:hypothetical protein
MTENLQESQGQPLTSRNDFPKVDYADTAYVAYLDAKEEAINEAAIANKRRREVSNTYFHSPNFLTTLSSYDYIVHDMPLVGPITTQKVEVPVSSVDTSSHSSEGSVEFESHKRIKLNSLQYAISHQANVVVCKYAYLARSDLYDTIVDSGATSHVINDATYATHEFNFTPANPEDGVRLGDNTIKLTALGYCDIGILKRIMIVPQMTINLISGSKLDLLGYAIVIMNQEAKLVKGTQLIATGHLINGLYHTNIADFIPRVNATYIAQSSSKQVSSARSRGVIRKNPVIQTSRDIELLHKRIGHASVTNVLEGLQAGTVSGYTVTAKRTQKKWVLQNGVCEQCMLGKSKLPSFSRSQTSKGESPGDYVVTDIMGPFATETFDGEKYALTYTDWYYSWTFL